MAEMQMQIVLSDDRLTAALNLLADGKIIGHVIMEAPDVSDLIRSLATVREALTDAVPKSLETKSIISAVDHPAWRVSDIPEHPGMKAMALRHPGLGWLGFSFPAEVAAEVGMWLGRRPGT